MQAPTDGTIQASYSKGFQVDSLPQTIHAKNDATQWMYGLEVFHQLHCLDYIRQSFYPGHYFPNETKHDVVYHRGMLSNFPLKIAADWLAKSIVLSICASR